MRWLLAFILGLTSSIACGQTSFTQHGSAELLFDKSDSKSALRASGSELKRDARDLNTQFVHMEAARLLLRQDEELKSALAILSLAAGGDPRATLAADRVRELAANTPIFRSSVPQIVELLRRNTAYQQELSEAMLNAANDGLPLPRQIRLTQRLRHWQIAGPFGDFSNVDFDRPWPPEQNLLRSTRYGNRFRENVDSESGELSFPDYLTGSGIYYAASTLSLTAAGIYTFTIESAGTYVIRVDDKQLIVHDSRFRRQASVSRTELKLGAGKHRVFVKLQLTTLPMRVWFQMEETRNGTVPNVRKAEERYLETALSLRDGDFSAKFLSTDTSSAISETSRADALLRATLDDQAQNSYKAALELDPNDLLAEYHLASSAYANQEFDTAIVHMSKILTAVPESWQAQKLKYEIAEHFDWTRESEEALAARLQLHPTCDAVTDAIKSYERRGDRERMAYYQARLKTCAPVPYQYWEHLSFRGEHALALASVGYFLVKHPNDRRALSLATREAVLAGNKAAAQNYSAGLLARAPNLPAVREIAKNPEAILDSQSADSNPGEFYRPFVRDAFPLMNTASEQQPSDSEILLNDRVVKIESGGAWIYQHTVTQVFDKKGIENAGELQLPHPADLLELRTVKRNGTFVEPEISDNKDSVSMPSLEEGDAVEVSYLQHYSLNSVVSSPQLLDFILGSSEAPTRSARFTMIRNLGAPELQLWTSPEIRKTSTERLAGQETASWEVNSLPALIEEPNAPHWESRARVLFLSLGTPPQSDPAVRLRDELIQATQITPRIEQIATTLQQTSARQKITAAYDLVMTTIQDESANWQPENIPSADQTFEQGEGSRATALIALISALGLDADLELAAERSNENPASDCPGARCFVHPLVRVRLPDSKEPILLDPGVNGLASGSASPDVSGERALVIPRMESTNPENVIVAATTDERSVANAQLDLDENGDLSGKIHVHFGSVRGAQMREALRQLSEKERTQYLEEIAQRIFPHAREISGFIVNEGDLEKPLELELKIEAPAFAQSNGSELEMGQLIPALGLSKLYATLPERHQHLLLETPLIESSEFVVRLPSGMEIKHLPQSISFKTAFGAYKTKFEPGPKALKISRAFRIPAQIVASDKYPAFSSFALDIDRAERELIELRRPSPGGKAADLKSQALSTPAN